MPGAVFDAGGLIALEKGDRGVVALLARAHETDASITIPSTALAQTIRRPQRQVRLTRLLRAPNTTVVSLDRSDATSVGRLLAASGTTDIADAHVVLCARRAHQRVVTSDPDDLRRLDPELEIVRV
ncbi:PIN domain-containing protein [Candidatus Poriferisodalis sp.]|uniref:PIN domain-containing protein n=1 Tax=Candidatus Poriferisodalis sp. TaxID=3101277 RepID=UPI003B028B8D